MIKHGSRTLTRGGWLGSGLMLLVLAGSAPAGEETAAPPVPNRNDLPGYRSFPRRARVALEAMAKRQGARVTRCLTTEQDGMITYEIHASRRRASLFRPADDFVLTRTTEPVAAAEQRHREQTLRARLGKLRDAALGRPPATVSSVGQLPTTP